MYKQESQVAHRYRPTTLAKVFSIVPNIRFFGLCFRYQIFRLRDGRVLIAAGDIADSRLDAVVTRLPIDPALMLTVTDRALHVDKPEHFFIAFVGIIDVVEGRFDYASAGHPMPCLKCHDGNRVQLAQSDVLLGTGIRSRRINHVVAFEPGSTLLFFTDMLTEILYNIYHGRMYKYAQSDQSMCMVKFEVNCADPTLLRCVFDSSDLVRVRKAQRSIEASLCALNYDADTVAYAELAFMELVGNAVRYAPGEITVVLDTSNTVAVLHVLDRGSGFTYHRHGMVDLTRESGRGLAIIDALMEDFSVNSRFDRGSHAKVVLQRRITPPKNPIGS